MVSTPHEHPIEPPHKVRFEVMHMKWLNLCFLHWPFDPAEVQVALPADLTVDTFDGQAWVGLVPFQMEVQLPGGVPIPREGQFPETNVRTYVRGPDGTPGVWSHEPWPLQQGRLASLDDGLMAAAGFEIPPVEPIVHWTTGVDVRIGRPRRVK